MGTISLIGNSSTSKVIFSFISLFVKIYLILTHKTSVELSINLIFGASYNFRLRFVKAYYPYSLTLTSKRPCEKINCSNNEQNLLTQTVTFQNFKMLKRMPFKV